MKKKIFVFLGGYLPAQKYGGPVTSIVNLIDNLKDYYDFYIISNDHDLDDPKKLKGIHDGWNDVRGAKVLYIKEEDYGTSNFVEIMSTFNVSMVYLSSVFYYQMNRPAIKAAKKMGIPILLAPRGEINENALGIKKTKKKAYLHFLKTSGFLNNIYFHATSEEEKRNIEKFLNISEKKIYLLPNMHGLRKKKLNTKEKNSLKIVFMSRIQEKKNLLYAIDIVSKLAGNVEFDIYGPIEQKNYWNKCKKAIAETNDNIVIKYCGALNPVEAKEVFKSYDCFLFPTLSENYGHVIVEAILSNCPCVISRDTTPWDDIHGNGGFSIYLEEKDEFVRTLNKISNMNEIEYTELCEKTSRYTDNKLKTGELTFGYKNMFFEVIGGDM